MRQTDDTIRVYSIKEVIQLLRTGQPATIEVCTYDVNRGKGGDRLRLENVTITGKSAGEFEKREKEISERKTDPNFKGNATINIRLANGETRTIHPVLIEKFNNISVAL